MGRLLVLLVLLAIAYTLVRLWPTRAPRLEGLQEPDYYAEWLALWERVA